MVPPPAVRTRADRCPGVLQPWSAADGALTRIRLVGGRVSGGQLVALARLATTYGDGRVRLTGRANLQLRGLPVGAAYEATVVPAVEATGLLPSRSHERVRNLLVSPATGLAGGRVDLGPTAARLDRLLRATPALADLPGRFRFVLDDGRGDLVDRPCDLGLVALSTGAAQLRVGDHWGPVVGLDEAPAALVELARRFAGERGDGPSAPWHVAELARPLLPAVAPDPRLPGPVPALPYGAGPAGRHVAAPDGALDAELVDTLAAYADLRVTPWYGVLVPA